MRTWNFNEARRYLFLLMEQSGDRMVRYADSRASVSFLCRRMGLPEGRLGAPM
jgi:hypothetical protein